MVVLLSLFFFSDSEDAMTTKCIPEKLNCVHIWRARVMARWPCSTWNRSLCVCACPTFCLSGEELSVTSGSRAAPCGRRHHEKRSFSFKSIRLMSKSEKQRHKKEHKRATEQRTEIVPLMFLEFVQAPFPVAGDIDCSATGFQQQSRAPAGIPH